LAKQALEQGFRQLIAVGGDGTLNEILNGCFKGKSPIFPNITLGMLPLGTGNDWVKTHHINQENWLQPLLDSKKAPHDVGVLDFHGQGEDQKRLFLNIASFGFAGTVVKKKEESKGQSCWSLGQYIVALLRALSSQKPFRGTVSLDNQVITDTFFNISAGNGKFFGGGMKILPQAQFQDGALHISIVQKIGKTKVALNVPRLFQGTYIKNREVRLEKSNKLSLSFENPVYCEAEGELIACSDSFEVNLLEKAIHVFSQAR